MDPGGLTPSPSISADIEPLSYQRRLSNEGGQTIVLVAVLLVVVLGFAAFAIDLGYAYFAHRSLQASADAAALAGAQELPDPSLAAATAHQYGTGTGARNYRDNFGEVTEKISLRCVSSLPACNPYNAVVVEESAEVPTFFARVLGIDTLSIETKATACSYCGVKPVDIMLVVDRTGSMCQDHGGDPDPSCADMNNEKKALRDFLGFLDPSRQRVGLAVFPPAASLSARCERPRDANYNSASSAYVVAPLSGDYSQLASTIDCLEAAGRTSYATAIEHAQAELNDHGRPGVAHIIIFFSDGAANIGPSYYPPESPYRRQPCHQGITSAAGVKAGGTIVYSIGYDLNAEEGGANICRNGNNYEQPEQPSISAYSTLEQIASSDSRGSFFYQEPDAARLSDVYLEIAADFSRGSSSLIADDTE